MSVSWVLGLTVGLLGAGDAVDPSAAVMKKVAILPFEVSAGLEESLGRTFSGALLGEIRKQRGSQVNIMAPDDVVQALPGPLRGRLKRCNMATCKGQMAQAVNADRALSGSIGKVGATAVLNLAILEAADGSQVTQWSGKSPLESIDKLLDQLPQAVRELFPAPSAPAPAAAAVPPAPAPTPPAVAAPAPAPAPVPAVDPLPPLAVAPLLPFEEPPEPAPAKAAQGPSELSASTVVPTQVPVVQPPPAPTWHKGLIGAGIAVMVPGVLLGALALVGGVVTAGLSGLAHYGAQQIYTEVKSVPHKQTRQTQDFDLSALLLLGQTMYRGALVGYGAGAVLGAVSLLCFMVGIMGGAGLIVAAAPRERPEQQATRTGGHR
jgi:hypothetical protein